MNRLCKLLGLCLMLHGQPGLKRVGFPNSRLTLSVPAEWIIRQHFQKFRDYEVKFDEMIFDPVTHSSVSILIYDSAYCGKISLNARRIDIVRKSDSMRFDDIQVLEQAIRKDGGVKLGYLKYRFATDSVADSYMVKVIYKDVNGFYYEIEIFNLGESEKVFRPIADGIFESIRF